MYSNWLEPPHARYLNVCWSIHLENGRWKKSIIERIIFRDLVSKYAKNQAQK